MEVISMGWSTALLDVKYCIVTSRGVGRGLSFRSSDASETLVLSLWGRWHNKKRRGMTERGPVCRTWAACCRS